MIRGLLATLFVLTAVCLVRADYMVIIADLNAKPPTRGPVGPGGRNQPQPPPPPRVPGPGGGAPGAPITDDSPNLIVAVVRVEGPPNGYMKTYKLLNQPVSFRHPWGKAKLLYKTPFYTTELLETAAGQVIPSVHVAFKTEHDKMVKEKGGVESGLKLAKWTLEHGLMDQFIKLMDQLAETDKANPTVAAYLKVKADLARPFSASDDPAGKWKSKMLDTYRVSQDNEHHYALIHGVDVAESDVKAMLDQLEKSIRTYYYWWASKGVVLPAPKERMTAVLADKTEDFNRLYKHLTGGAVVCDSFFARRESLSVFAGKRGDDAYNQLMTMTTAKYWENGFARNELLTGKAKAGMPKNAEKLALAEVLLARTYALMLKAMEQEWEQTSTTHQASRQLLFASGLLPNNVHVPEWIQFGMGSFFETPQQSPWGSAAAPNCYWMPRFRDYLATGKYQPANRDTLIKVITDGYFRDQSGAFSPGSGSQYELSTVEEGAGERRGQAASWSLAYFLAQTELDGLQRYFRELSSMPRDVELDDKVLIAAFARAFDCVDANKTVDNGKLSNLADRWINFLKTQPMEGEATHKKIRAAHAKMAKGRRPSLRRPGIFRRPPIGPGRLPPATPPGRPGRPGPGRPGG